MDKCKYYLKVNGVTKVFNSDAELTSFVKDNVDLKNNKAFVKYSLTSSGVETQQDKIIKKITKGINPFSKDFVTRSTFLSLYHSINGKPAELLSPVLIKDNYINNASQELLKTNPELSALYKTDPDNALKQAKQQIADELSKDNRMLDISKAMSTLMKSMIKDKKALTDKDINSVFEIVAKYNLHDELTGDEAKDKPLIEQYVKDNFTLETKKNFRNQMELWYNTIATSNNSFMGKVWLNKTQNIQGQPGISSEVPYLSISPDGRVDIYEIAVSRNEYDDWHSAKKLTTDFRLGVNRQLMENITDMSKSSMYIQTVIFPESDGKINLNAFHFGKKEDRSRFDQNPMFAEDGDHTLALRQLLPAEKKIEVEDGKELVEKANKILGVMFPKYNFRTKLITTDYERKYKSIVNAAEGQPKLFIYDDKNIKREEENTPEGRERFKKVVEEVVKASNANKNSKVIDLMKEIRSIKEGPSENKTAEEIKFAGGSVTLQNTFQKYLSDEWTLLERPDLLNAGILLFKNNSSLTAEAVVLTVNNLKQVNNLGLGTKILGKFKKDNYFKSDDKILSAKTSHIETMKGLVVLNNDPSILKGYGLQTVKVYDMFSNDLDYVNLDRALYNFNLLIKETQKFEDISNNFSGNKPEIRTADMLKALYAEIISSTAITTNSKLRSFVDPIEKLDELTDNYAKLQWFKNLREKLVQSNTYLSKLDPTRIQDYSNPTDYLYFLVSMGVAYYSGVDSEFDYENPRWGIRKDDALHWLKSTFYGSAPDYDENGNKVVGLFQGQHFNTTEALQSVYMTKLHDMITIAQNDVVEEFNKKKNIIINATNKYYDAIGRSNLAKTLIGNSDQFHEVLFERHNGKITNDFKLLNPWDVSNQLTTPQRDYLKTIIFCQYINGKKANLEHDTLEKFENSVDFSEMMANGKFDLLLRVPLVKKQSLSRFKTLTTDGLRKFIGQTWDSMKNAIDPRDLTGEELEERQKVGAYNSINGLNKMYNQFDSQESEAFRDRLVTKYGVGY